jgi:hypothetical protein
MSGLMEVTQFKANTMLSYMTQFHDDYIFFQTTVMACDWEYLLTKVSRWAGNGQTRKQGFIGDPTLAV